MKKFALLAVVLFSSVFAHAQERPLLKPMSVNVFYWLKGITDDGSIKSSVFKENPQYKNNRAAFCYDIVTRVKFVTERLSDHMIFLYDESGLIPTEPGSADTIEKIRVLKAIPGWMEFKKFLESHASFLRDYCVGNKVVGKKSKRIILAYEMANYLDELNDKARKLAGNLEALATKEEAEYDIAKRCPVVAAPTPAPAPTPVPEATPAPEVKPAPTPAPVEEEKPEASPAPVQEEEKPVAIDEELL